MSGESGQKELAAKYLLGTLSEEERAQMEERYFSDDASFEEVEIAEEELIDRYVRGELSDSERNRLEATLAASPRLTERVEFARVWKKKLAASTDPSRAAPDGEHAKTERRKTNWWSNLFGFSGVAHAPRFATAFAVLLLLVGGAVLLISWVKAREARQFAAQQAEQRQRELDRQAADSKSQADQLATQSPQPSPTGSVTPPGQIVDQNSPTNKPFLALTLSPGATRGGGPSNDLRITPGTKEVRLTLNLRDTDYTSYRAVVQPVGGGAAKFSRGGLISRRTRTGAAINIQVPASSLPPGDYLIRLEGRTSAGTTESVEDYSFRIIK